MMKYVFLVAGILASSLLAAQTPVAHYPFTGNANDAAGTNNGTVNGAVLTTDRSGAANRAYSFDGINDNITAQRPISSTSNFTISGWVKVNSLSASQILIYNGNSSLDGYGFYLNTSGTLYILHGGIAFYSTSVTIATGQWYFLCMVHQSGTTIVYVNGVPAFSGNTGTPNSPTDLFYMSGSTSGAEPFNGSLDEIKVFNSQLTPEQVSAEYGITTPEDFRSVGSGAWSAPATWELFNGTAYIPAYTTPSSSSGSITIRSGHTVSINASVSIDQTVVESGAVLDQNADIALLNGAGTDLVISGTYNWNTGLINTPGSVTIESGGALNINNNVNHGLRVSITNNGTINWQDGNIRFSDNPTITNNGLFTIAANMFVLPDFSTGTIINNGTIAKTSSGTTLLSGLASFTNGPTGVIKGIGTLQMSADSYINNGTLAPGNSPGILAFESNLPLSANSTLQIELANGTGAGTGHDQLTRNGSMVLGGTLTVTETGTVPDGTYTIISLSSGVLSGYFDAISKPAGYTVVVNSTSVQLVKGSANLNPAFAGSGKAISFDGTNDVIQIPNAANDDFTYELWIKTSQVGPNSGSQAFTGAGILSGDVGSTTSGDFIPMALNGNFISFGTGDPDQTITASVAINDNKWHHVAVTRSKGTLTKKIYIDGIERASGSCSNLSYNGNPNIYIGADFVDNVFFNGSLDELRVWDIALTQSQIRDRMCRKISNADALYANLVAYYNFDESVGIITFDGTGRANDGSFINDPTRETSGAAIGNASSHDYVNATKTVSIAHSSGESFTVTSASGNPEAIQVYRIDEKPDNLTGAPGVGSNNKYFGVFQVNGTSPQYTAVYDYTGNPGFTATNESNLRLYKRTDNATAAWTLLSNTPNIANNTITVSGESTEYILGKLGFALPVKILSFTGNKQKEDALLQWKTAQEIRFSHFELERSIDGVSFSAIGTIPAGTGDYRFTDSNVFASKANVYYRLKSIDADALYTYSSIIRLSKQGGVQLAVYPNPASSIISISGLKQQGSITIYNQDGKQLVRQPVTAKTMTVDLSKYAKGVYLLVCEQNGMEITRKIIKQ